MSVRCSVCAAGVSIARYVDASPDLSAAALSRQAETMGMDLSAERILTHRKHRQIEEPARTAKTKADFAVIVRDRAVEQFAAEELDLANRDSVPGIAAGLKAQALIDSREKQKAKQGNAELAFAIIAMLTGQERPLALPDPTIIEGEAVDLGEAD